MKTVRVYFPQKMKQAQALKALKDEHEALLKEVSDRYAGRLQIKTGSFAGKPK